VSAGGEEVDRDVEIVRRETVYRGFFDLDVLQLRHRRFDGGMSAPLRRELFKIDDAVCVLPYDPERDAVVLIEQFRVGALDHPRGPWLLECVAGLMDEGETAEGTARREIVEETGLRPRRIEKIGTYAATPGAVTEHVTCFVAQVDAREAGGVHGLASEHEDIKTHLVDAGEAFGWIDEGRITAVNALVPLRWLQVHRHDLRRRWQSAA